MNPGSMPRFRGVINLCMRGGIESILIITFTLSLLCIITRKCTNNGYKKFNEE